MSQNNAPSVQSGETKDDEQKAASSSCTTTTVITSSSANDIKCIQMDIQRIRLVSDTLKVYSCARFIWVVRFGFTEILFL